MHLRGSASDRWASLKLAHESCDSSKSSQVNGCQGTGLCETGCWPVRQPNTMPAGYDQHVGAVLCCAGSQFRGERLGDYSCTSGMLVSLVKLKKTNKASVEDQACCAVLHHAVLCCRAGGAAQGGAGAGAAAAGGTRQGQVSGGLIEAVSGPVTQAVVTTGPAI